MKTYKFPMEYIVHTHQYTDNYCNEFLINYNEVGSNNWIKKDKVPMDLKLIQSSTANMDQALLIVVSAAGDAWTSSTHPLKVAHIE